MRYFAWHLLHERVFNWSTQLGKRLCVQDTVMKIVVLVDGAPKPLKENATKDEAEAIKKKFDGIATIEIK